MPKSITRLALLGSLILQVGILCAEIDGAAAPAVISTALTTDSALVRVLRVNLRMASPIEVEYWTDRGPRLLARSAAATSHIVTLVRLRPGRLYQYRIRETDTRGTFRTDPLPDDLAALRFTASGTPTVPLVLVHLFDQKGFKGYVIVDATGEVVWFWRTKDFPFGAARRANHNCVFMDQGRGIVEVTPGGAVVRELPQEAPERGMHHDVITTPSDTILYLAFDTEEVNGARLKGEAIWEWSPEVGRLERRWRSWDHLSPTLDRGPRFGTEWMHANSLAVGPRGNILVSVHYFNQILSLTPDMRTIEWRLGGVRATIAVPENAQFSGQHTAHEVAPGRVLLFDNGRDRGDYSRAMELVITGAAATTVWQWKPTRVNYASAVSSARRLASGNTLVAFGMSQGQTGASGPTEAFEVSPNGTTRWHLLVTGTTTMYRVEPLTAIGTELVAGR